MIGRGAILILAGNAIGAVGGLLVLALVGRFMGPGPYGVLAFGLGVATIGMILTHGLHPAHVRIVNLQKEADNTFTTFATLKTAAVLFVAVATAILAYSWDRQRGFTDATTLASIIACIALVTSDELRNILVVHFEASRRFASAQLVYLAENLARIPLAFGAAFLFGVATGQDVPFAAALGRLVRSISGDRVYDAGDGAVLLAFTFVGATLFSAVIGWQLHARQGLSFSPFSTTVSKEYGRLAGPLAVTSVLAVIAAKTDVLMVGYFWDASEVGLYYAAQRLASLMGVISIAFGTVFLPTIAPLIAMGAHQAVKDVGETTQRIMGLALFPAAMLAFVYAPEGISIIISDSFASATPSLRALVVQIVLLTLMVVHIQALQAAAATRLILRLSPIYVLSIIGLNLILIPEQIGQIKLYGLGATGAAIGSALGQFIIVFVAVLATKQALGVIIWSNTIWGQAATAIVVALALWWIKSWPIWAGLPGLVYLAIHGLMGLALFYAALGITRQVGAKDLIALRDLVNRKAFTADVGRDLGFNKD